MKFLQRKVFFELENHLDKKEISLILGPRQAGKTTLMLKLAQKLNQKNKANIYFNLDVFEDKNYFTTQHSLLAKIKQTIGPKGFVFIDEVQRLQNAGLFLKGLWDMKTPYKFIVSGSGSLELKADILEPMTGRKKIFYCLPLSWTEFLNFKLKTNLESTLPNCPQSPKLARLIDQYLTFGGYPRVVLAQTNEEKIVVLKEIFQSYLEKDIQLLLKVEKDQAFSRLVQILAQQTGSLLNQQSLCQNLGITQKTLKKYLYFLEKTFVIRLVRPFFTNVKKELRKSPKPYFLDLGLLQLSAGILPQAGQNISGNIFENACFLRLLELDLFKIPCFWRTSSGAEVDFVFTSPKTGKYLAVEVKIKPNKEGILGKSLISFIKKYHPERVFIYNKSLKSETKRWKTPIIYLPFHFLPELDYSLSSRE